MKRAIVVGSGAAGAVVARRLQGDFDVTVLEAGSEFRTFDWSLPRLERLRGTGLLLDERMISALFPAMRVVKAAGGMPVIRGICTGGTTTMFTGNIVRCDGALRELGLDLDPEFAVLRSMLPVSSAHQRRWRAATRSLFETCRRMGLDPEATPKAIDMTRCAHCGRCVLGCARGAKWDSRRLLAEATSRGARLVTRTKVERVALSGAESSLHRRRSVSGVVVKRGGRRELLTADVVVLAAGGLGTPAILDASGIRTEHRLFVDPVLCVAAPWPGARLNEEVAMPFIVDRGDYIVSPYMDYLSFFFNRDWRRPGRDVLSLMVKLADVEEGQVDGHRVRKSLVSRDKRRLREAVDLSSEILAQAGADRRSLFLGTLNAGHPGGTLPLRSDSVDEMRDPRLPDNLYVADASLLPRSLGKPPSMTIMALAQRVATVCSTRFA